METHCPMDWENLLDSKFAALFSQVKVKKE